jgi:ribosomal protein S18 acetylase RimI-like enzyme
MPDTPSIRVHRAAVEDVDLAVPLFAAYREFYGLPPAVADARAFLRERLERGESVVLLARLAPMSHPTLVAESAEVVGFAQLYPSFSSLSLAPTMILNDLFVAPPARRLGVAGRLVDAAAEHAREAGAIRLELATQHSNESARRLYIAKGFVVETEFAHMSLALDAPGDAAAGA